jgi:hypothetical protein
LIKFFRSKDLIIYNDLANALDSIADAEDDPVDPSIAPPIPAVATLMTSSTRAHAFLSQIPTVEMEFATSLVMGEKTVAIPGRYNPLEAPSRPKLTLVTVVLRLKIPTYVLNPEIAS